MADVPDNPDSREETYLAGIAGQDVELPACPYSRKEAYLEAIGGRLDDVDTKIAALATDFSYKGSVENYASLPAAPAVGDVYTTSDDGKMYVWDGNAWQVLNMAGVELLQTTGTATDKAMSQNAVTSMVYADPATKKLVTIGDGAINTASTNYPGVAIGANASVTDNSSVAIGQGAKASGAGNVVIGGGVNATNHSYQIVIGDGRAQGLSSIAIGQSSKTMSSRGVAIGPDSESAKGSVAIGAFSKATQTGEMNIGSVSADYGYNNSNYRLLTGLYDPQSAHDAATKGYVDGLVGDIESTLDTINNGTGA